MTALSKDSGGRRRQTPIRSTISSKTRDFFKLAANMANPSIKMSLCNKIDLSTKSLIQDRIIVSSFLDPTYQKCMRTFSADLDDQQASSTECLFVKEPQDEEQKHACAIALHQAIIHNFEQDPPKAFRFKDARAPNPKEIIIDSGALFWANRLKNKSWQMTAGVESGVRYFHANLCSHSSALEVDLLYWLRFDEQGQPLFGALVN